MYWKAAGSLEEGDRGGIGPKTGRNATEEDEGSIPAVGPTQPPIQWLQLQGREANHSSPFSVELQTASTLPGAFRMCCSRTGTTFTFKLKTRERFQERKNKTPKRLTGWKPSEVQQCSKSDILYAINNVFHLQSHHSSLSYRNNRQSRKCKRSTRPMPGKHCGRLTLYSPEVTVCTTRFNIQQFYILLRVHFCVLCGSENKQRLFPYTTLMGSYNSFIPLKLSGYYMYR